MPHQTFVQCHDDDEGEGTDDEKLWQDTHIPPYDIPTDCKDNCLMEYVEGKDGLVAVGEGLAFEIQILRSKTQHENNRAPVPNAHYDLKEHVAN